MKKENRVIIFLIIYILILYHFYSFNPINNRYSALMTGITIIFNVFLLLNNFRKQQNSRLSKYFNLIIVSAILTVIFSTISWNVPFLAGVARMSLYFTPLIFLYLERNRIRSQAVERIMVILSLTYLFCWTYQLISLPDIIFGSREIEIENLTRGFYRFYISTKEHFPFIIFFLISLSFKKKKPMILLLALGAYIIVILHVGRQMMFWSGLFAVILLFRLNVSKFKNLMIVVFLFIGAYYYIIQLDVVESIFHMTEDSAGGVNELGTNNIRFEAMAAFINEYSNSLITILFGNGVPVSDTALFYHDLSFNNQGYFRSDVGFVGMYCDAGIVSVVLYILVFVTVLFKTKIPKNYLYLKYYLLYMIFSYLGSHTVTSNMVFVIMAIYIIYAASVRYNTQEKALIL